MRCGSGSRLADGHAAAAAAQACRRGAARAQGAARRQGRPVARQRVLGAVAASGDARALTRAAALAPLAPRVRVRSPPCARFRRPPVWNYMAAPAPRAAAAGASTAAACCLQAAHALPCARRPCTCLSGLAARRRSVSLPSDLGHSKASWQPRERRGAAVSMANKGPGSLVSAGARLLAGGRGGPGHGQHDGGPPGP